jgi:hypothetical protein
MLTYLHTQHKLQQITQPLIPVGETNQSTNHAPANQLQDYVSKEKPTKVDMIYKARMSQKQQGTIS